MSDAPVGWLSVSCTARWASVSRGWATTFAAKYARRASGAWTNNSRGKPSTAGVSVVRIDDQSFVVGCRSRSRDEYLLQLKLALAHVSGFERGDHAGVECCVADDWLEHTPGLRVAQALLEDHLVGFQRRQKVPQLA